MLEVALKRLHAIAPDTFSRVADQGAGKLRNLDQIGASARELWIIDTPRQLATSVVVRERNVPLVAVAKAWSRRRSVRMHLLTSEAFSRTALGLDLICSVCVFDVVPRATRAEIIHGAVRNLRHGGWYLVIVPRNDSSILRRCRGTNRFDDGHVFAHHGAYTFYRNFEDPRSLIRRMEAAGLRLVEDLSRYRYVTLLMQRR